MIRLGEMFYTYVIRSKKDHRWYTGMTDSIRKRFRDHSEGNVRSTKGRGPFEMIYCEGCLNKTDALEREKYLKSGMGKRYLKNRLKHFLVSKGPAPLEIRRASAPGARPITNQAGRSPPKSRHWCATYHDPYAAVDRQLKAHRPG